MPHPPTIALPFVQNCFEQFQNAYEKQNFGDAFASFVRALWADAGIAYPYFICRASAAVDSTLRQTGNSAQLAEWLDKLFLQHPNMTLLCDNAPETIRRLHELRDTNIKNGLASIALVTQGKAASVSVSRIFNSGFNLPSFAYSLVTLEVVDSWVRDYARGGACYTTHLDPRPENIARLKRAGIKSIVHLRDPRQWLLSMIHHVSQYPDQLTALSKNEFHLRTIRQQMDDLLPFYVNRIQWIQGWVDAEDELKMMFSTFEDYVKDRDGFIDRYVDFHGGKREFFCYDHATAEQPGTDYHFRAGLVDEWRNVFPAEQAKRLSAWLPEELKHRFGWPP